MSILYATLVIAILGTILGIGLSIAHKFLAVKKNELTAEIEEILPGANCGACGYPGCSGYASALSSEDNVAINLCTPGGSKVQKMIAKLLELEAEASDDRKMVAYIHCNSKKEERVDNFNYKGIKDCRAAATIFDGSIACKNSCLQLGSCIPVCPTDAISYDEFNRVVIDKNLCIACGKCIDICPHKVISLIPYDATYAISCNNTDKGGVVRKI